MFIEFFDWFCSSLKSVFITMDKFILFDNFSYFDFAVGLLATGIIFRILKLIMLIEDEEAYYGQPDSSGYIKRYDEYIGKHERYNGYRGKHELNSSYEGKHASYGRHGSRWL